MDLLISYKVDNKFILILLGVAAKPVTLLVPQRGAPIKKSDIRAVPVLSKSVKYECSIW